MPGFSIDGISSGIQTGEFVDAIIQFERRPAVLLEYQQAQKINIVSTFQALQAKLLALNVQTSKLSAARTFNASSVKVSDDNILSATSTGRLGTGSYDIQVLSLARNHQLASQGFDDESTAVFGTGTIDIMVGDGSLNSVTIDSSNNSLVGIKKAINDADMGVRANIVNDGSDSKNFRLILLSQKTGVANELTITSNLTGGNNLNYETSSFDDPEVISFDSGSDSVASLGATAAFTGTTNKIYTFTVAGTGSQTVGSDNITINWTDGTDSGSILITQADAEVDLVGNGSDGLKLSLSAGDMNAGDTFQVSTFAPLLQEAADAKIALGSTGGNGSPITITSDTNEFNSVISGMSLTIKAETDPGESVNITTDIDVSGIKDSIKGFISAYNDVMDFIDKQNTYNKDTKESGVLFGDSTVHMVQAAIRNAIGQKIDGLDSKYNQLFSVGIRTGMDGKLAIRDSARFEEALRDDLDEVIKLFTDSGSSSITGMEFVSATEATTVGESFEVDITQAATRGRFQGSGITDPGTTPLVLNSSNNRLKFILDGINSDEIILSEKTYNSTSELVKEIQQKLDNDDKIGKYGMTVEWVSTGADSGYLNFSAATYGSNSSVNIVAALPSSAYATLGMLSGAGHSGLDVAGTINGEKATGKGLYLTGDEDNATTDGLKIKITLDSSQVVVGSEGTITVTRGLGARLGDRLDSFTMSGDGLFDRRIASNQKQAEQIKERIADIDERLLLRRERLLLQFRRMEEVLGQLNAQSSFLTSQLANANANWGFNRNR